MLSDIQQTITVPSVNTKVIYAYLKFDATVTYQSGGISSYTSPTTGTYNINISNGFFSSKPIVIATAGAGSNPSLSEGIFYDYVNSTTTTLIVYTDFNSTPSNADLSVIIIGPA